MTESPEPIRRTYTVPELYDIAFDYRDVDGECDFMLSVADHLRPEKVHSTLELACGPAYHTRVLAKRGLTANGLDLMPEMCAYTRMLIAEEMLTANIIEADMRSFTTERKYDFAFNLICSINHLLTNDDIVAHLHAVADALTNGGIYHIQTAHPKELWASSDDDNYSKPEWTAERDGLTVTCEWGKEDLGFDPISEVDEFVVRFTVTSQGETRSYKSVERMRRLSYQTFRALVAQSGRFEIAAEYGDYADDVPFDLSDASGRYLCFLRKVR